MTDQLTGAFQDAAGKAEAEQQFMLIAAGYEVLKDEDSRREYDYMLDHPEEVYTNYYRYYARRLAPRLDWRLVLLVLTTIASAIQWYSGAVSHITLTTVLCAAERSATIVCRWCACYSHSATITRLAGVPRYR